MKEGLIIHTNACYQRAEQQAAKYFQSLKTLVSQKTYISTLTKDFHVWKQSHIRHSLFSLGKQKADSRGYDYYLRWLDYRGKLDSYLDRSISYIYMRDLGKALDSPDTQAEIRQAVNRLKIYLRGHDDKAKDFSMVGLYRWAQKEGIESTFIWLAEKLKRVSAHIPQGLDAVQAQRKLIKIIAGVSMHALDEMGDRLSSEQRAKKLDEAIRLGYAYGLTYPFIDDLLDSSVLSASEKKQYSNMIRTTLVTGVVPKWGHWSGKNTTLMRYIHSELREAFDYLKTHHRGVAGNQFFEQAYVFFQSQETDRVKELDHANYSNEDIYIPVILKSASSRLIVRSIVGASEDEGFDKRTFFYGIYNQLADDFADLFDDLKSGAVTPYTYYWKYHRTRPDLLNPFELYWAVIAHLIHHVYHSDPKACEVILDRAINGLKRYKVRMGTKQYNEVMALFDFGEPKFTQLIQQLVHKADDVDFFDKLLRDHIISILKNQQQEREDFFHMVDMVRTQINNSLAIAEGDSLPQDIITTAANYSLEGNGKRLRPIITWFMAVKEYRLNNAAIVPLLRSLEYMHTASLIFDDLPSQDNAQTRRGRATLHKKYNTAVAELTGLFLTQKAVTEQASLDAFDSKNVLRLIQYSSQTTAELCKGQAMDLQTKGKPLTREQLTLMSFYKTGLAFEASLLMPAILAGADEAEIIVLKKFARHAGIAFQIKDDLLDVEGDVKLLGKPVGQDAENNHSTFVSVLGLDGAKQEMWEHYCLAIEALKEIPRNLTFLKHLLNYIVNREQ